ncbi:hypothetical protein CLV42_12611 [Chitinophaga ginsengisoli]|uniref:Uncharacterized protein n=1 Tax=Chitinophaga ginsengisoli TaxID=363837 RepID=A0A2P8FDV3_9BACT|nr:hypothetical protein CLV42_12611 [Chitinophaga ginsengisoli]
MKGLGPEFVDHTKGADSWDGIDLITSTRVNSHRDRIWSNESLDLLVKYKEKFNGGVDVSAWKY